MDPLLGALQQWAGPGQIRDDLHNLGLRVPSIYHEGIASFCSRQRLPCDVVKYLDEVSKECVSSGGMDEGRGANIGIAGFYRSKYLDWLYEFSKLSPGEGVLSGHPCLRQYYVSIETGSGIYRKIKAVVEERKAVEFDALGLDVRGWTGLRRDAVSLVEEAASAKGFMRSEMKLRGRRRAEGAASTRRGFAKHDNSGLKFFLGLDSSSLPRIAGSVPLEFWVDHSESSAAQFFAGDLRFVIPGIEEYGSFGGGKSAVLGIHALVEAFDRFALSFGTA